MIAVESNTYSIQWNHLKGQHRHRIPCKTSKLLNDTYIVNNNNKSDIYANDGTISLANSCYKQLEHIIEVTNKSCIAHRKYDLFQIIDTKQRYRGELMDTL